jgi:FkbM family methyltransferase
VTAAGKQERGVFRRSREAFGEWRQQKFGSRSLGRVALRLAGIATAGELAAQAEVMRQLAARNASLTDELAVQGEVVHHFAAHNAALGGELERARENVIHLRRVEDAYAAAQDALGDVRRELKAAEDARDLRAAELDAARRGAQTFVDFWQRVLFETHGTTDQSRLAATLVSGNRPVDESLETLVNLSEAVHGARPFQFIVPFLAASRPFPRPWPTNMAPLRIVDVGSQELATEEDVYAPLRRAAPAEIIGFDPFAQATDGQGGRVSRPDGAKVYTYRNVVADGNPATLHVNRHDPTSSIFPSNLKLAAQFGMLAAALETIETREFSSTRLDDILPDVQVDFLKIDVQGAARLVLANASRVLSKTLVCHVEVEFAPVYDGEPLFADVDACLREAGFCFVDFYNLGRQRYVSFESSPHRAFHRGRTLWGDCIYIRSLDDPDALTGDELFRTALIVHACYNKQDLAAELLGRIDDRKCRSGQDSPVPMAQ